MFKFIRKIILFVVFFYLLLGSWLRAEIINKINIEEILKMNIKIKNDIEYSIKK